LLVTHKNIFFIKQLTKQFKPLHHNNTFAFVRRIFSMTSSCFFLQLERNHINEIHYTTNDEQDEKTTHQTVQAPSP
jgi:hypothetical protein